ncbi:MAG: hypothetical protein Q7S74_03670 [Nanoarchaeota archaeon]|nr:hypothetical protein [Nanoarchaeota archaeon]
MNQIMTTAMRKVFKDFNISNSMMVKEVGFGCCICSSSNFVTALDNKYTINFKSIGGAFF